VFCHEDPEVLFKPPRQIFYGSQKNFLEEYKTSQLRYKRVMNEGQIEVGGLPGFENLEI
jgi:hypothetical protein